MIDPSLWAFGDKRVLLLQGPIGPFFRRLATDLRESGATVFKINFNGGDCLFYPSGATLFRGKPCEWPDFFKKYITDNRIEMVMLFGDCRPIHEVAHRICRIQGVEIGVFEEGYLRPDYVSFERYGVNGNSLLPRNPKFYRRIVIAKYEKPLPVGNAFWYATVWAMLYNTVGAILKPFFPHYQHHRTLTITEGLLWLRSFWRKYYYAKKEKEIGRWLSGDLAHRYFLVPLQVHNDAQIYKHSDFSSVGDFIKQVLQSFADDAPINTHLVVKHHPLDRGCSDYTELIETCVEELGLQGRVYYVHDLPMPALLRHTRGVVTINSTVGLAALQHGVPLKILGKAIYAIEGLVFPDSLASFWRTPKRGNMELYRQFRTYLIRVAQLNGSFYRRLALAESHSGIVWSRWKKSV